MTKERLGGTEEEEGEEKCACVGYNKQMKCGSLLPCSNRLELIAST